jgi:C-terminal processing protease CtpA/Prc
MRNAITTSRIALLIFLLPVLAAAQQDKDMSYDQRTQVNSALNQISKDVVKHYYDPKLHGVNWDAKVQQTTEKIRLEKSLNMAMAHVAALLDSLNDSHTFLIPPRRPYVLDHGWNVQMIGDKCYVAQVRPGGDVDSHGVKPGDQLIAINGYRIGRENLWKIEYAFNTLRPQPQLTLTLRSPDGAERKAMLEARFRKQTGLKDLDNYDTIQDLMMEEENWSKEQSIRAEELGNDLTIAKLKSFQFDEGSANKLISIARKRKALILDLRENPGGSVEILKLVVGGLFDHDVKLGDRVARDNTKPLVAKTNHHPFEGKVIVLIDGKSASASELLARVVQLEKRGTVIGDRSSGSVMESRVYGYEVGTGVVTFYGASITDANLLMTDGVSLEHQGVAPDELILPTAADLANGRDPVLAHAAELAGVKLTAEQAGKLFPHLWPEDR